MSEAIAAVGARDMRTAGLPSVGFRCAAAILLAAAVARGPIAAAQGGAWTHYAKDAARRAVTTRSPEALTAALWQAGEHPPGEPIVHEGPSGPVVNDGRVFANARVYEFGQHTANQLVATDAETGDVAFATRIERAVFESWSSPAVDVVHGIVLIGSGARLYAVDAAGGDVRWATVFDPGGGRPVVNASAAVLSDAERGRAFITDYTGFDGGGSLYCVNLSPFNAATNPHDPGAVVWREPIGGTIGNTPALLDGVVYVTSAGESGFGTSGQVLAFDIEGPPSGRRRWAWTLPASHGFYGGVTVVNGFVYAASYNLHGSGDSSRLVKLRASDGQAMWVVPCNRTASIPIVHGSRVYLSTGLAGFGSVPTVQAFDDLESSAVKAWDTYADTGGSLIVGGWSHQPALGDGRLYAGAIPTGGGTFGAYTDLYVLDVARRPGDPGFVVDRRPGMGSSPAIVDGRIYTIGATGLFCVAATGDCDGDGQLSAGDVPCFAAALTGASASAARTALLDSDGNGRLDGEDVAGMMERLLAP